MFLFNRLTFGHKNALAYFHNIMQTVVDESDDIVVVYLDIIIFGDWLDIVWKVVIRVIAKLIAAGFMINIKKSKVSYTRKLECLGL